MKAIEINRHKADLKRVLRGNIQKSIYMVTRSCKRRGNKMQEPDYVAALSLFFTPLLKDTLQSFFPQYKFFVTGIYCHQKPIVDIGLSKKPELGDIMFIYIERTSTGEIRHNSLLFQAKMHKDATFYLSRDEGHQFELYRNWPKFKYFRANNLNGTERNVQPKTIHDGAQYLWINNSLQDLPFHPYSSGMTCAIPEQPLSPDKSLEKELVDFFKFKSGRAFEADAKNTEDDWTKIVWDLLKIAKGKATRRKNSGFPNFPRITPGTPSLDGFFFLGGSIGFTSIFTGLNNKEIDPEWIEGNINKLATFSEEDGGVAVIVIECNMEAK